MPTWATGELVTAAKMNENTGPIYTCTETDVTASRAVDGTVYQNTSGKLMFATITIQCGVTGAANIYCSANASPAQIAQVGIAPNAVSFFIPPNYYYKVSQAVATISLLYWIEWTLF